MKKTKFFKWLKITAFVILVALVIYQTFANNKNTSAPLPEPVTISTEEAVLGKNSDIEAYFTRPKSIYNKETRDVENALNQIINQADKSLNIAMFELDLESFTSALLNAKNRGVEIKIVYDNEYTDKDDNIKRLQDAGIPTVADKRSAYMHNKFIIVDNACVWTGSFNFTENAAVKNNENALYICDPKISQNYQTEFSEMFAGNFGPNSNPNTPYPVINQSDYFLENYFSPEDDPLDKIISKLSSAKEQILVMAFSLTDDQLGEILSDKAQSGLDVRVIFEKSGASTQYSECSRLTKTNAQVYLDNNPNTFHHKIILIDGKIIITGSFNFSQNATKSNDENLIITNNNQVFNQYYQEYLEQERLAEPTTSCK